MLLSPKDAATKHHGKFTAKGSGSAYTKPAAGRVVPRLIEPRNERLMAARMNAGLTQGQLAKAVGLSRQIVNQYERLQARPTPKTGERIARFLSLHTGEVMRYDDLFPVVSVTARDMLDEGAA